MKFQTAKIQAMQIARNVVLMAMNVTLSNYYENRSYSRYYLLGWRQKKHANTRRCQTLIAVKETRHA
jgi:hypothetical protein